MARQERMSIIDEEIRKAEAMLTPEFQEFLSDEAFNYWQLRLAIWVQERGIAQWQMKAQSIMEGMHGQLQYLQKKQDEHIDRSASKRKDKYNTYM